MCEVFKSIKQESDKGLLFVGERYRRNQDDLLRGTVVQGCWASVHVSAVGCGAVTVLLAAYVGGDAAGRYCSRGTGRERVCFQVV
jgi:hypothetical protein